MIFSLFRSKVSFLLLIILFTTLSCEQSVEAERSTWDIIQQDIFEPNCVACHTAGTTFAEQSNLVLTSDAAYGQLVDRLPSNQAALNDGLELVGTKGVESLFKSYLWEKINFPDFEHYYADHADYGELMPLGGPSLTNGELEFIRRWIVAGAPAKGSVSETDLLHDESRFEIPEEDFTVLEPPVNGIQLNLGPFEVPAQFEREFWYYQPLNNAGKLYVTRFESNMRSGSHHLILYDYPDVDEPTPETFRDIRNSDGSINYATAISVRDNRFVFGTQLRNTSYELPEGVALELPADYGLDINSHYVNYSDELKQGEISVNLHTIEAAEVNHLAQNLFLNNQNIYLPAGKETTLERTWTFNSKRNIFLLTSHAHQYNTEFRIYIVGGERDGELVFFSQDWEHPPLMEYDPPLVLNAGEGLRAVATYNNTTDNTLEFGLLSVNEMMIIFGMYF